MMWERGGWRGLGTDVGKTFELVHTSAPEAFVAEDSCGLHGGRLSSSPL